MSVPAIGCLTAAILITAAPAAATGPDSAARVPAALAESVAEPGREVALRGHASPTPARCEAPAQEQRQGEKPLPRVVGWLYRFARGFDIERSTSASPLTYLRSPLLAGFHEPGACPPAESAARRPRPPSCVAVTASDGHEHVATYLLSLPQLGARAPAELAAALRERLNNGERVALRTLGSGAVELDPAHASKLDVRACESEMD